MSDTEKLINTLENINETLTKTNWNIGAIRSILEKNPELLSKIKDAEQEEDI